MVTVMSSMAASPMMPAVDIIPDDLIPDAFDPTVILAKAMRTARDSIISDVEKYIASPPRISSTTTIQELYEVALAPTGRYAWLVVFFAIVMAILTFRACGRVVYSFIVLLAVVAFAPSYVYLINQLLALGDNLTEVASGMFRDVLPDTVESLGNPVLDIVSFGMVVGASMLIYGGFVSTEPMFILAVFLLPIAFSVSALGSRTRNVFNALASITLVLAVIGRPIAVLTIELFQGVAAAEPGEQDAATQNVVTAFSFFLAIVMQLVMMLVVFVGIKQVQGAIASQVTRINSQVKTSVRNVVRVRVDKSGVRKVNQPIPVVITSPQKSVGSTARADAKNAGVKVAINVTALAAGAATGNPKVGAVVKKGGDTIHSTVKKSKGA